MGYEQRPSVQQDIWYGMTEMDRRRQKSFEKSMPGANILLSFDPKAKYWQIPNEREYRRLFKGLIPEKWVINQFSVEDDFRRAEREGVRLRREWVNGIILYPIPDIAYWAETQMLDNIQLIILGMRSEMYKGKQLNQLNEEQIRKRVGRLPLSETDAFAFAVEEGQNIAAFHGQIEHFIDQSGGTALTFLSTVFPFLQSHRH